MRRITVLISTLVCALIGGALTPVVTATSASAIANNTYMCATGLPGTGASGLIYEIENGVLAFGNCSGAFVVPSGVTSIGANAFERVTALTSVTFADASKITSIGAYAFNGATSLTSFTMPANVTSIGAYAFYGATSLTSITIPAGVTSLGASAFNGATKLTSITIPAGVTSLTGVFSGATKLTSVTFAAGSTLTSIGASVFMNTALTSISIPAGVTSIGTNAFKGTALTSISIPAGVTSIGASAFQGTSLTSITVPANVTSIGASAFSLVPLADVTFAAGSKLTSIGATAFYGAKITSITIPAEVTSIGDEAFASLTSLTSLTFAPGSKLTSIGATAFYNAPKLTSITIPASVSSIGSGAFAAGTNLKDIYFLGNAPSADSNVFEGTSGAKAHIKSTATGFPIEGQTWNGLVVEDDLNNVTFNVASGSAVTSVSFTAGTGGTIETAPVSTRAGYSLTGWSTSAAGSVVTFPYSPTADITLYAIWSANTNTVTYSSDSGSVVNAGSFTTGGTIETAPVSTRAGYTLTGWSTSAAGSVVTFPYSPTATSDITLYAIWKQNLVKATYASGVKLTGKTKVGETITASPGMWNGTAKVTYKYQWYLCTVVSTKVLTTGKVAPKCTSIKSATKVSFKATSKEKGSYLAVLITGTNAIGNSTIFTATVGKVT